MINLSPHISISEDEIEVTAIRAQGAGGQNVNKVSTAIHLRFDIRASSLPESCKQRLLHRRDHRINKDGILVIKAQRSRTQENNRADAIQRLKVIIQSALTVNKKRRPTRPTKGSQKRRLDSKTQRGKIKLLRRRVFA